MLECIVNDKEEGRRTDRFLMKMLPKAPGSLIYKALRTKQIKVNNLRAEAGTKLMANDTVQIYFSEERLAELGYRSTVPVTKNVQSKIQVPVLYEDEQILILNKPAGVLSQKDTPESYSLSEYLLEYLEPEGGWRGTFRPGLCNRLDRGTSGIVVAGKTLGALQSLTASIREHESEKTYLAICQGVCPWKKEMWLRHEWHKDVRQNRVTLRRIYVGPQPVQDTHFEEQAVCRVKVLGVSKQNHMTFFELHLITGKSHQLRAQLASEGFPIIGDHKYCKAMQREKNTHQLLHAWRFQAKQLQEPLKYLENRIFQAPLPEDFAAILKKTFPAMVSIYCEHGEDYV